MQKWVEKNTPRASCTVGGGCLSFASMVGLREDAYVEGVAAVFTGGCLSAVPALSYFSKKRKRVGMKIEI